MGKYCNIKTTFSQVSNVVSRTAEGKTDLRRPEAVARRACSSPLLTLQWLSETSASVNWSFILNETLNLSWENCEKSAALQGTQKRSFMTWPLLFASCYMMLFNLQIRLWRLQTGARPIQHIKKCCFDEIKNIKKEQAICSKTLLRDNQTQCFHCMGIYQLCWRLFLVDIFITRNITKGWVCELIKKRCTISLQRQKCCRDEARKVKNGVLTVFI